MPMTYYGIEELNSTMPTEMKIVMTIVVAAVVITVFAIDAFKSKKHKDDNDEQGGI